MAIKVSNAEDDAGDGDEESDEEFAARVYGALMEIARGTSGKLRSQLGACVLMRTPYARAPEPVKEAIRDFIEAAEL